LKKIQSKIHFSNSSLENLINQLIEEKMKEVKYSLKNGAFNHYNHSENYPSTNNKDEKVDEIK
jgi:hypothetical protein